jgi:hypothetical protein
MDVKARLERLAELLTRPQASAETCELCRTLLPDYVEAECEGQAIDSLYPPVRAHLEACLACQAEYADQLTIARLEATNQLPQLTRKPRFDLSFLPQPELAPAHIVYTSAQAIVQAVSADRLEELGLIRDRLIEVWDRLIEQFEFRPIQITSPQVLSFASDVKVTRWAMATFLGLQAMRATTSREEIERLKAAGEDELHAFLTSIAQDAARQMKMRGGDRRKFAAAFARTHARERWDELLAWMTRP